MPLIKCLYALPMMHTDLKAGALRIETELLRPAKLCFAGRRAGVESLLKRPNLFIN
jgi:hypothetical protein